MSPVLLIVLAIIVIAIVWMVAMYNGLVQRRLRVDEAWPQIDVQLKRRHDLIPNLVNAVKGYMGFEQRVLENVTQARANAVAAGVQGPRARAAAEGQLTATLRSLQEQLTTTESVPRARRTTPPCAPTTRASRPSPPSSWPV